MTELRLDVNKLTEVPEEIGNLTNLSKLWLSFNKFTELPKEICNLINLVYLDVGVVPFTVSEETNQLTELPEEKIILQT